MPMHCESPAYRVQRCDEDACAEERRGTVDGLMRVSQGARAIAVPVPAAHHCRWRCGDAELQLAASALADINAQVRECGKGVRLRTVGSPRLFLNTFLE